MFKITPNPPDTDPATSSRTIDSNNPLAPNDTTPSAADIQATPRKLCTMFFVNPELDTESLLAHACESLASANVMAGDLADQLSRPQRSTALAIQQIVMLAELAVNRALDRVDPQT